MSAAVFEEGNCPRLNDDRATVRDSNPHPLLTSLIINALRPQPTQAN